MKVVDVLAAASIGLIITLAAMCIGVGLYYFWDEIVWSVVIPGLMGWIAVSMFVYKLDK